MAFKFVLGHHLKTLLNDFEDKQKKDINDFAKGHLNESRLLQAPLLLNRKSWASSRQSISKNHKKQSQKRQTELIQPQTNGQECTKLDALLDFTLGTSGFIPHLPAKLSNNPDVRYRLTSESNREREVREKSPQSLYSQLDDGTLVEELPLQEIQIPMSSDLRPNMSKNKKPDLSSIEDVVLGTTAVDPSRHSIMEMYSRGITKRDQYKKMKSFETVVLRKKEMSEQKILSGEKATKHHEKKLEKELAALKLNSQSSNFHKLQVFSSVFEDIIDESPLFNQILQSIKDKYDNYIAHILDKQILQDDLLREQVNQMSATGMSRPEEMAAAAERLVYLEEMTRCLLKLNQRLHEEVKSQRHYLNKTPEVPAKRTPPGGYSRKETPVELSVELENMKALILEKLDELNALHVQIRDDYVPITVCTHLEQCIKETEGEVQKLLKQNEYFERSIAEMEAELKEAIVEADTSEKDARRIWNKVNSVREMFGSQANGDNKTREEDLDEESKWNWYIS